MKRLSMLSSLIFVSGGVWLRAQQPAHYLDLVGYPMRPKVEQATRPTRVPQSMAMPADQRLHPNSLSIRLLSLEYQNYTEGDPFVYEVIIRNSGDTPINFPWVPDDAAATRSQSTTKAACLQQRTVTR